MRKMTLLLFAAILAISAATPFAGSTPSPVPSASADAKKYTCPMHPEVVEDKPGKCPKCEMALVPQKEEKPKK